MIQSADLNKYMATFSGERFVPGATNRRIASDHWARYRFASSYVRDKDVLDVACGVGYAAPLLIKAGAKRYHGVDISAESIDYALQHYSGNRVSFEVGDICDPGLTDVYDLITCFETIEHVSDYETALDRMYAALKPNGILLISSPNRHVTSPKARSLTDQPANRFHTQEFSPEELRVLLLKTGFEITEADLFGQRQRWRFSTSFSKLLISTFDLPDVFAYVSSSKVTALRGRTPRYIVLVARKPSGRSA